MTDQLTDDGLRKLKQGGGQRTASDPRVLNLLEGVVNNYKWEQIHWLTDPREDVFHDWYATRLHGGRLASMIDKAKSIGALRAIAADDLKQYAIGVLRAELPTRLFTRLNKILIKHPDRFAVMLTSKTPGSTCWTLTERPASAVFSDRDEQLESLVWAVDLTTIDEKADAAKQTQFITASELERYAYEMLESSARGLTLDQLVRGLVLVYDLTPGHVELPDENTPYDPATPSPVLPATPEPSLPLDNRAEAAQQLLAALTDRHTRVLRYLSREYKPREIADELGCSESVVSADIRAIRDTLVTLGPPEEHPAILASTEILQLDDDHEL
jgi:DNA-binding CsgD family transcriptional regulator